MATNPTFTKVIEEDDVFVLRTAGGADKLVFAPFTVDDSGDITFNGDFVLTGALTQEDGDMVFRSASNGGFKFEDEADNQLFYIDHTGNGQLTGNLIVGNGVTVTGNSLIYRSTSGTGAQLILEQGGAGDATLEWLLTGGQAYFMGIDNSDSDKLKIGTVSGFGSAVFWSATIAGVVTLANNTIFTTSLQSPIIDTVSGTLSLKTAGLTQVIISAIASASRNLILAGSNGGNPTIDVSAGSLAITPATVFAAGVTVGGSSTYQLTFAGSATYPRISSSSSASGLIIAANDSGSNAIVRLNSTTTGATIAGVDTTGAASYKNLILDGTVVNFLTGGALQVQIGGTNASNRNIVLAGSNGGNPTISTSAGSLAITPATVFASTISATAITGTSTLTLTISGNNNNILLGANGAAGYGIISLNGATTSAGNIGLSGGATADASLYVQAKTGGSVIVQINGIAQGAFLETASANRYITFTGANSGNPTINTTGGSLAITPAVVCASTVQATSFNTGSSAWTFGIVNAVTLTSPNKTLTVTVAGTTYYIPAKLTDD